jgi:hypothetical protein
VALTLSCGAVAALVVSPFVGAVVLTAVALALALGRRGRTVLSLGAIVALVSAVGLVLARQAWRGGLPPDFEWPAYFSRSHVLAWIAVLLVTADVVIGLVLARRRPPPAAPQNERGDPS